MRTFIRKLIYGNDWLFGIFHSYFRLPNYPSLDHFIHQFSKSKKRIRFIQIGANDGLNNDPIYKYVRRDRWQGILIEPQPNVFQQLLENYPTHKRLTFVNAAIADPTEELQLYRFSFADRRWLHGWTTFDRDQLVDTFHNSSYFREMAEKEKLTVPETVEEAIETVEIEKLSFMDLVEKHGMNDFDILVMDVEGYELEILKMIDFDTVQIKVILFEHRLSQENESIRIQEILRKFGYAILRFKYDSIAVKNGHPMAKYLA